MDTAREWRGGQQQTAWLVEGLCALGHRVHLFAPPDGALWQRLEGVEALRRHPARPDAHPRNVAGLRALARRNVSRLAVAQTPHAHGLCVAAGLRPVVHRRVDFPPGAAPWSRWKYARARGFVAVSRAVARILESAGVPADRIRVVHDGVQPIPPSPPAPDLEDPRPLVGALGALVAHKGHRHLVRAMADLPGVRCILAGEGPLAAELEDQIRELGLGDRVWLAGYRRDRAALFASLDVFVHPSVEEGMGQVVAEALTVGCPVVATRAGGVPEVLGAPEDLEDQREQGILVPPASPEALARGIRMALARPHASVSVRRRAGARFSVDRMVRETLAAYRSLLETRLAAPGTQPVSPEPVGRST